MAARYDVVVVGAGLVGLATALRLLERHPGLRLAIVEKETAVARHQSGHNSGVVHAGVYYAPGSRKARLCREGKAELERFAAAHGIPLERSGKLVVAVRPAELPGLAALAARASANEVPGLEEVGPERIAELEPHVRGLRALYSPTTGVVDFEAVARAFAAEVLSRGAELLLGWRVLAIEQTAVSSRAAGGRECRLETTGGTIRSEAVVTCAGLDSDRLAALTGDAGRERIVAFRGDYFILGSAARGLVRALVYPVNDPRFPFLGVHLTRRIDGAVWAGPNAVPALSREGYGRLDVSPGYLARTLSYRGFLRLGLRYWRTGALEMWRDVSRGAYAAELRRYVPELRDEDLLPGPSGVRAQSLRLDGTLVDDFSFGGHGRVLHVRNAPSPAATASLAIGREIAELAERRFELPGPTA